MYLHTEISQGELFDRLRQLQLRLVLVYGHTLHLLGTGQSLSLPPILIRPQFILSRWSRWTVLSHQNSSESKGSNDGQSYSANHVRLYGWKITPIQQVKLYSIEKMTENVSIELEGRRVRDLNQLKKLLPKGCCAMEEFKKYEYIRAFLKDRFVHRYILPINHVYAPFVVIRKLPEGQKYPIYQLYHHPTSSFVFAAQEQNMNIGCNYIISSKEKPSKNEFFIAKLRGNFSRSEFNIFDNGSNPQKSRTNPRKQLGFITVGESSVWSKDDKLTMYIPRAYQSNRSISEIHKYQPIEFLCQTSNPNPILQDFKQKYNTVQSLHLKETGQGQGGKAGKRGPERLVLESSVRTETVVVQRKSETYYQLGIGSPLTIVQGFAFLLALVEAKLI